MLPVYLASRKNLIKSIDPKQTKHNDDMMLKFKYVLALTAVLIAIYCPSLSSTHAMNINWNLSLMNKYPNFILRLYFFNQAC